MESRKHVHTEEEERTFSIDREESKKMKSKKGGKFGLKGKIITVVLACGIVISLVVGGLHYAYNYVPNQSQTSLTSIVSTYCDTLLIDEALSEEAYAGLAAAMANLETEINLYNELGDLDLSKYSEGLKPVDISEFTKEDIKALISEFNSTKGEVDLKTPTSKTTRFYSVVAALKTYTDSLGTGVYTASANDVVDYVELLIKTSVAKSLNLPVAEIENMSTNLRETNGDALVVTYVDVTGHEYKMDISFFNLLNRLVKETRKLVSIMNPTPDENGVAPQVDAAEVKKQEEVVFNCIKAVMEFSFYVEDGTIHQNGNQLFRSKVTN